MYPIILSIGPITIYSFGLMMALGFLAAGHLTGKELTRKGWDGELASSLLMWAVIGGVGGARLLAILGGWDHFIADLTTPDGRNIISRVLGAVVSGSGFVWYGGFIGGSLAVTAAIRRHGLPWLVVVDSIAPGLALGHGIGRIGCHLAGDGDWGVVTTLPWGVAYTDAIIGWSHPPGVVVHPAPLYEMTAYFAVCAFLWARRTQSQPHGTAFCWYLILAPTARLLIEFIRINDPLLFGLTEAQVVSIVLIALGVIGLRVLQSQTTPASHSSARVPS